MEMIRQPVLVGRHKEIAALKECMMSPKSEFVIVCGRRRIGKTFLIDQYFGGRYDFSFVGKHNMPTRQQLSYFAKELSRYAQRKYNVFKNWYEAFDALEDYLNTLPDNRKKIIFIDEMPWIDSQRSSFVNALENFWNGWANRRHDIVLIASGSATSWMADNLLENQGGLHNRVTRRLYLEPFTLAETEAYFNSLDAPFGRPDILDCYMLTGGVPFYLSLIDPQKSIPQNIDALCFDRNAPLRGEYEELYNALFRHVDAYLKIVELLYNHKQGLTRQEISKATNLNGKFLSTILKNLRQCDFIEKYALYGKKNASVYRLMDFYTLFYLKFLVNHNSKDYNWWSHNLNDPGIKAWKGLTFELICMRHHLQIKKALGISGIGTEVSTWKTKPNEKDGIPGAQIDMVISRKDRVTHLCEMKFSQEEFFITKDYESKLRQRMGIFREITGTHDTLVNTFVTLFGVGSGKHKGIVNSEVILDDLFQPS